jgi:hypothetical protein
MPHASSQALTDHLQALFGAGTCAGLTDEELIERFKASRDAGGERAFEALVTRHGPMVLSVCRTILNDPADLHDAFQATFTGPSRHMRGSFRDTLRNRPVRDRRLVVGAASVLARGVLTTMMLKKLTIAGCVILSLGVAAVGGGALIRTSRAQDPKPGPVGTDAPTSREPIEQVVKSVDIDSQLGKLLAAARQRVEAQRAYYEEGRLTLDRFIDALVRLEKAELIAAKTESERMQIRQRHVRLLGEIENREVADLQVGRGTVSDVSEARQRHLEAEYEMKQIVREVAEKSAIIRRLSELERKVELLGRERTEKPVGKP